MSNIVTTKDFFSRPEVMRKFKELLNDKATGFVSSVLQSVNSNDLLKKADPKTIYASAMMGAMLDLPINQNLGFAYIVPYKGQAQFQMGYKGFIQLAQRTGQYKSINAVPVYEGNFVSWNPLTEELEVDYTKPRGTEIVGYASYFELINGFSKTLYWSREEVEQHAKTYSKSYSYSSSPWQSNFDEMACKTVLKRILSKYGPLSIEIQRATVADQGVIHEYNTETEEIEVEYVDNDSNNHVEIDPLPEFTENDFKRAKDSGATIEMIKEGYTITPEIEAKFLEYVGAEN